MDYYNMDFYLNENNLIADKSNIRTNLKEIKDIYDLLKVKNYKLFMKDNLDIDHTQFMGDGQIALALNFLQYLEHIPTNGIDFVEYNDIEPDICGNYYFLELMSLCYRDSNELILSLSNEKEIINSEYSIIRDDKCTLIKNIIGKDTLEEFLISNPAPQSINEVFEKAEQEFPHIKFTRKAYDTAKKRAHIYKQFGFNKLLIIFKVVERLLYPFLKGELSGFNQKSMETEFKRQALGVEFSNDSTETMNKYGFQREVTIKGEKIKMSYHIKPSDNRIYFIYDEKDDCIYVGHSGGHLDVVG